MTADADGAAGVAARRSRVLARRRLLDPAAVATASAAVAGRVDRLAEALPPGRASAYFATGGEVDPAPSAALLRRRGWTVWYPVVAAGPPGPMRFRRWDSTDLPPAGRLGLPAPPDGVAEIAAVDLDVALVPLVVFGPGGVRAGRGGGHYDRTFASPADAAPTDGRPLLVGLAHDLQEDPGLVARSWDVPLDVTVTPTRTLWW